MRDFALSFVSIFSIVNPFSAIPAFVSLTSEAGDERPHLGVIPLGMQLLAGPGAISVMIIAAGRTDSAAGHASVLGAALVVALLAWLILLAASSIARVLGRTGMNIATRFMGLILAAIAVEFIASGLGELFPAWTVTG